MINVLSILFTLSVSGLLLLFIRKPVTESRDFKNQKIYRYGMAFLACTLVFLLTIELGHIPVGLHVDEAGMAYDALSLARFKVDRFLYVNPVYFINFGGGQNALYTYLTSFLLHFLNFNTTTIRLPAVFLAFLSSFCFVRIVKKEKGKKAAMILMLLLCVLPFMIMHARWGLESYLFFPMSILSFFCLQKAFMYHKKWWFFASGCSLGITLYTYAVTYLILPIFLLIFFLYALIRKQVSIKECFCLGIPLFFLALPLILMLLVNNGIIPEITTPWLSIPKLFFYRGSEFSLANILKNWNLFGILFSQDGLIYNAFSEFGTLYYFSIPLCLYGFVLTCQKGWQTIKEHKVSLDLAVLIFFLSVLLVTLTLDGPNINRANAIYFPLIYFILIGILELVLKKSFTIYPLVFMYLIFFGLFSYTYFVRYPNTVHDTYFFVTEENVADAISFASQLDASQIYVLDEGYHQPYIYTVLALEMDPYTFNEQRVMDGVDVVEIGKYHFRLDEIDEENIYIFLKNEQVPSEMAEYDFQTMNFGSVVVYY